ncbi:hypothetical protein ACET3Z_015105 [Daucus carota]
MDQFGVLVESIGFKSQNRSTPLADLKGKTHGNNGFSSNLGFNSKPSPSSVDGSGLDGFFVSNNVSKAQNYDGFDVFNGSNEYDLDSIFKGSNNSAAKPGFVQDSDDIFNVFSGPKYMGEKNYDNVFVKIPPPPKANDLNDDLLGGFDDMGLKPNSVQNDSVYVSKNDSGFDDLILGFEEGGASRKREKSETNSSRRSSGQHGKSNKITVDDPFSFFETSAPNPLNQGESKVSEDTDVFESIFGAHTRTRNVQKPSSVTKDSVYDALFQKSKVPANQGSGNYSTTRKVSPAINVDDDFSFLSEVEVVPPSGKFQEVEGESEERRRHRLNHHQNTQERMIKALNEKNRRDRQAQLEQEERHRLAATLDDEIKRWAQGKEGNLRALLSSLQYVLWPECGWRPVSLTDMMTSISVKKVYQKATLCVHPDKVQQKGATIQQKYIAEKVFDVLKEAYNKFSSEEL